MQGKIIEGFLLGFGAAFGFALGNGLIGLVVAALSHGRVG
jgi:hypothetical protein